MTLIVTILLLLAATLYSCVYIAATYLLLPSLSEEKGPRSSRLWRSGGICLHCGYGSCAGPGITGIPILVPVPVPAAQPQQAAAAFNAALLRATTQH